ncbi:lyase family protein, partial [Tenuifilum sp.]|uniref:lyase family protein n=1 Tax=Tenuifilum sp. TaxID=2760880 RepID=UPI002C92A29F|nr:lyase family protein [Tenuifilum sp.]HPP90372.1 lyase family protein [Tenuifilum sp.]
MSRKSYVDFLSNIELFRGLSEQELNTLVKGIVEREFPTGSMLFIENNKREGILVIYEGQVELFKSNPYGVELKLTQFSKGDFLGEGVLASESTHSTSARAIAPTKALLLRVEDLNANPAIALKVLTNITRVMQRRMRYANNRMVNPASQYESGATRLEHDLLGEREVPAEYYYGVQTLRALENFNISGVTLNFYPDLIDALAMVKQAAAEANHELGLLEPTIKDAIIKACTEITNGKFHNQFVVDMIQGGAGTSTNMNANEVIANRALEHLGYSKGEYQYCHPLNHVNMSQSTNDAYPTAVKIALINSNKKLVRVLESLIESFRAKAKEFAHVIKMGRTQLQDAVPMTLGQEFEA